MLSICIATYNYPVTKLVTELHKQCCAAAIDFEILVADDCSELLYDEENKKLAQFQQIIYWRMGGNVGRAAIRNELARRAKFSYLLFLDCDAEIENPRFIEHYIAAAHKQCVICGGVDYQKEKPVPTKRLRWKYGVQREMLSAEQRSASGKGLTTFNMLIDREILMRIGFNESIRTYGYEDTLFEYTLKKQGYIITHIDNAAFHVGLDDNIVFLKKIEESLFTLQQLACNNTIDSDFLQFIKIYRVYCWCNTYKLTLFVRLLFRVKHVFLRYIIQKNAPLWVLDLYKLGYFCELQYPRFRN
ncbi:MAG: glycosyltransferase [Bacteroidales bacterium]|jgi:glycosyltransferase involved in cell wall biosynthesis|nr:glycosyltransferase [Bacteroidales bacterium]